MPALVSALLAMSQELTYFAPPMRSNCTEQSAGAAITVTGAFSAADASAGFTAVVSIWNTGNTASVATPRPASITGLRPILSESQAKKT